MKNKTLIISRFHGIGGVETHIFNLCGELISNGRIISIGSRYYNADIPIFKKKDKLKYRFYTTPFAKNIKLFRLSTLYSIFIWPFLLGFRSFDVIYTLELSFLTRFYRLFLKRGGKMIWNPVGAPKDIEQIFNNYGKKYLHNGVINNIIVESEIHLYYLQKYSDQVSVIPHISNVEKAKQITKRPSSEFRIAHLGRIDDNKGVFRLYEVFKKSKLDNCILSYYGEGILKEKLIEKVNQDNLQSRVFFYPKWESREELERIHSEIDLVTLFSHSEGLPLVLIECLAFGTPFLATNVGSIKEIEVLPYAKAIDFSEEQMQAELEALKVLIFKQQIDKSKLFEKFTSKFSREILMSKYLAVFYGE